METVGIGNIESPMVIALHLTCAAGKRKELIQWWAEEVEKQARSAGLDVNDPNFALLSCSLEACGGKVSYRTVDDIPLVDVLCPCGDPNHWLIKWTEPGE